MEKQLDNRSLPPTVDSDGKERFQLECDLLDYLSLNKAAQFTNKLTGEPELDRDKKRDIAQELLKNSYGLFLARFGPHLQEKHLVYFNSNVNDDEKYIVDVHLQQLRKIHVKYVDKASIF